MVLALRTAALSLGFLLFASLGSALSQETTTEGTNTPALIYFATYGGEILFYSSTTSSVRSVLKGSIANFKDITHDPIADKIYICGSNEIYRANADGSNGLETIWAYSGAQFVQFRAIAVDWLTGNLYVVSYIGPSFICSARSVSRNFSCATIFPGISFNGIALNPPQGNMYLAVNGAIWRADMDGSNVETLAFAVRTPIGIAIDYDSSRLYWADYMESVIQSSDFSGNDLRTNVKLEKGSFPWGMAVAGGYVYWGGSDTWVGAQLGRSTTNGEDIRVVYNATSTILHLAAIESHSSFGQAQNPCDGHGCSHICAIRARSIRCFCPDGMHMSQDQMTCIY